MRLLLLTLLVIMVSTCNIDRYVPTLSESFFHTEYLIEDTHARTITMNFTGGRGMRTEEIHGYFDPVNNRWVTGRIIIRACTVEHTPPNTIDLRWADGTQDMITVWEISPNQYNVFYDSGEQEIWTKI